MFRLNALKHGELLKGLCAGAGLEGLFPLDAEGSASADPSVRARWICESNLTLIRSCDVVMAALDDFRGTGEPDAGTAFEVGFATALGKPVFAYAGDIRPLVERVPNHRDRQGRAICERGYIVEDFTLPMNLMLACSVTLVEGGPAECVSAIADAFEGELKKARPFMQWSGSTGVLTGTD